MPQVSIIVPHQGDASAFERTLVSVLEHRPNDAEVIVPHHRYDDPYNLSDEVLFVDVPRRPSTGIFIQAACEHSSSNILHLLTNGVEVTEGWCDWAVAHFQDPYVGSVVPVIVDNEDHEEVINVGLKADFVMRRKAIGRSVKSPKKLRHLDPAGPTSTAAFYRKSALAQIDRLTSLGESEIDLQLALALSELGYESKLETDCKILWDEMTSTAVSPIRRGRQMQQTVLTFAGIDGVLKSTLTTAAAIGVELVAAPVFPSNLLRIGGRLIGMLDASRSRSMRASLLESHGPHGEHLLKLDNARTQERASKSGSSRRAA